MPTLPPLLGRILGQIYAPVDHAHVLDDEDMGLAPGLPPGYPGVCPRVGTPVGRRDVPMVLSGLRQDGTSEICRQVVSKLYQPGIGAGVGEVLVSNGLLCPGAI